MSTDRHSVTVVGGGLAGMTAALHLRQLGCTVELVEASAGLGGEAGSKLIDGRWEDHGYHVFFPWYVNTFRLHADLGITDNFRDSQRYYQLQPGDYPSFHRRWSGLSRELRLSDLRSGNLSGADQILYYYTLLDLASQRYDASGSDESIGDFLRSRWYVTPAATSEMERLVKTSVITMDEHSARSMRRAMSFFTRHMSPLYRMPCAPLEHAFIAPFRNRLEDLGVRVRTGVRLNRVELAGDRVAALHLQTAQGAVREPVGSGSPPGHGHDVVLAIPHHAVTGLAGSTELLERAGLSASAFHALRSEALASLHLYFDEPIPHLPRDHIRLVGSRYELTFVDIARNYDGLKGSVLNFCLVPEELIDRAPEHVARTVVAEVKRFIPTVDWSGVTHVVFQPNVDAPFYSNDTGSWDRRPDPATALRNLWMAGDHVRSPIDIGGMENAVTTGLLAADGVRAARRLAATPVPIRYPRQMTPRQAALVRTLLTPVAMLAKRTADRRTS